MYIGFLPPGCRNRALTGACWLGLMSTRQNDAYQLLAVHSEINERSTWVLVLISRNAER